MWMSSWLARLNQSLTTQNLQNPSPRIAIVGIGHELRGDDGVGPFILRRLLSSLKTKETYLLVDAGPAPENFTLLLREFMPDLVILIDAAEMHQSPGKIEWLPWQDSIGLSASTHSLPVHLFAQYLQLELECEILLLGIQPSSLSMDSGLSPTVRRSAEKIILGLMTLLASPRFRATADRRTVKNPHHSSIANHKQQPRQERISSWHY
jgi:hydrogenase 3 maturation protease